MTYQDCFEYVFIWHTLGPNPCPRCLALDGRQFSGQDLFASVLVDPEFGPIWNLDANHSMMHGGSGINCHCILEVQVETVRLENFEGIADLNRFLETH